MDAYFKQAYRIGYRGLDAGLGAGVPVVLELMQETGTRHTDSTPFPMSWHRDNKNGFIITNLTVSLRRQPRLGETVEVVTAPISFRGMKAERFYVMYDKNGEVVADSYTAWVFIDLERRKPQRIPAELGQGYGSFGGFDGDRDVSLPAPASDAPVCEDSFAVRRRDVDANLHVNNIAYVYWALEYVPAGLYGPPGPAVAKARYKKECAAGDVVTARTYETGEGGYLTYFDGGDGQRLAEVFTQWRV